MPRDDPGSSLDAVLVAQSPEEVEKALAAVFSRPEFAPPERSPVWRWLAEALSAAWNFLRGLLPALELGEGGRGIVFWLVVALLLLATGSILLRIAGRVSRARRNRVAAARARRHPGAGTALPDGGGAWEDRARALAGAGHWREAALALYQALLHRLAARGALRLAGAKTPGDYRRESAGDAEAHRTLVTFLRTFEPVAFGGRPADRTVYERLVEAGGLGSLGG